GFESRQVRFTLSEGFWHFAQQMETGKCKKYPIVCGFSPVKSHHPAVLSPMVVSVLSFLEYLIGIIDD
ncbi:MAG: hypothetical protein KAR64_09690, partial [Thermoplasmatales archaeon]|nr:hypothetical protein [Thermoplasmatales archaeon]